MNVSVFDIAWRVEGKPEDECYIWWHVGKPRFEAVFNWSVFVN